MEDLNKTPDLGEAKRVVARINNILLDNDHLITRLHCIYKFCGDNSCDDDLIQIKFAGCELWNSYEDERSYDDQDNYIVSLENHIIDKLQEYAGNFTEVVNMIV